jgi:hypothetical protein
MPRKTAAAESATHQGSLPTPEELSLEVGDAIVVRHSELADFRHCPLKHRWGWTQGWYSPSRESGGRRELGTVWHDVLKVRYRYLQQCQNDGVTPDEAVILQEVGQVIATAHTELRETLYWMYDGYREHFGWDPDWRVISVEQKLVVPFHDENDQPMTVFDHRTGLIRPVLYSWMTDILVASRTYRGILVVDTKSTSQAMSQMDVDLSDQFGLYTVAWRRRGLKVVGQLVNMAQTKKLKRPQTIEERFVRRPSIRTPNELRNIELDAVRTIRAMYSEANHQGSYSAPDPRTCSWKCDFKEVHLRLRREADPEGRTELIMKRFGMETGATHGQ